MSHFSKEFLTWLDTNADHIDQDLDQLRTNFLKKLAENDVFKIRTYLLSLNGLGGGPTQVVDVLNELAQHSLTACLYFLGTPYFHRVLS